MFDEPLKYGKPNPTQEEYCFDINICPDLLVAAIGAFGALALGVLYVTITMEQPRRRKRGTDAYSAPMGLSETLDPMIRDIFMSGRTPQVALW